MTSNQFRSDWTDERIDALKKYWADGLSCSLIAAALGNGTTRNAVISKASRLNLPSRETTTQAPRRPRAPGPRRMKPTVSRFLPERPTPLKVARQRRAAQGDGAPVFDEPLDMTPCEAHANIPVEQRRTLLELNADTCRWPVGDPAESSFFFCGAPPVEGRPYCPAHTARATDTVRMRRAQEAFEKKSAFVQFRQQPQRSR